MTERAKVPVSPADIASPTVYLDGIPHEGFAAIRAVDGLVWHPYGDEGDRSGFWAVTRHADVREVSKNPEAFSSAIGHTNLWDLEADALEARRSLIDSDAPDHTRLRRVVSKAFTPRTTRTWEGMARDIAAELVEGYAAEGGGDWVEKVAAPLPIRVILAILGVPAEDAEYMVELTNHLVEGTGEGSSLPEDAYGNTTPTRLLPFNSPASHALYEYAEKMRRLRMDQSGDDLVTSLLEAEADGERLTAAEYRNFFQLLVFAGNETTRTAMIHGAMAFAEHPDQWARLQADPSLVTTAVDEVIRWASPILHMRRTASRDVELAGTEIAEGDKVVMWYAGANRDPEVFDDPYAFDVGRADNPHYAFGGGGPHFCLGAFLARMEVQVLLEEMLARDVVLELCSSPVRQASNFVHGVSSVELAVA
ncbi:MAG: cytochrome P450 [Acidimicrobiaceae bacterium]|nr:cytochrome P450 [Acidimicrobiaceae bacterium]